VENYLRGYKYDRKTHKWVRAREPLLSEYGINTIIMTLTPYVSKVFSMSHFEEKRIKQMTHSFNKDLILLIGTDTDNRLGIKPEFRSMIVRLVGNMVYATLRKAYGGLSLGVVKDSTESREIRNVERSGGLFSRILRR